MSCKNLDKCRCCPQLLFCTFKNTETIIDLLQVSSGEVLDKILEVMEQSLEKQTTIESNQILIMDWLKKVEPVINENTINIHKILLAVTKESEAINEPIAIETKTKKSFLGLGKEKVVAVNAEE